MANNIRLHINHSNATRMEHFLNGVEDELSAAPFEWRSWKKSDCILDGCRFISTDSKRPLTISILFCDSYQEANEIAKANALPHIATAKWSVNGAVLYLVECEDADQVSNILGLFAGEE